LGIASGFAPLYTRGFGTRPGRGGLGVPTAFNFLGPLINPAQRRWAGRVCQRDEGPVMAEVFAGRGATVLVVRGDDGLTS